MNIRSPAEGSDGTKGRWRIARKVAKDRVIPRRDQGDQRRAAACIASLRVLRFAADRTAIRAGEATLLRWSVDTGGCPRPGLAGLTLNGARVSASGTREVRPSGTITYRLVARSMGIVRSLGRVEITVDDSSCNPVELSESEVAPLIRGSVKSSIEAYNTDRATENKVPPA